MTTFIMNRYGPSARHPLDGRQSIAKLPELFETLIERVTDTPEKLKVRTQRANELVAAIKAAAEEIAAPKGKQ